MSINVLHKNLLKINNDIYVNNNNNNNKTFNSTSSSSTSTTTSTSLLQNVDNNAENDVKFNVNNVVCSYSTRCHLNLRKIAMEGMHVEYKKENGMVNMKLRNPCSTASIWSSGKITCTGSKSEADAYKAARCYCRLLQKLGFRVKLCNYRVVNVLATCSMPFEIDIVKLANDYPKECSYEPELHPGATFTLKDIKTTLKIFTTGSITLTAPAVSIIETALKKICPMLNNYRMIKSLPITSTNNIETSFNHKNTNNDYLNSNKIIINHSHHVYHHPHHHHQQHHPAAAPLNILINNNNNNNNQYIQSTNTFIPQQTNTTTIPTLANNFNIYSSHQNININSSSNNSLINNNIINNNNNNNNGYNLMHSSNNKNYKSFLIDEMDEEFLP